MDHLGEARVIDGIFQYIDFLKGRFCSQEVFVGATVSDSMELV